MVQMLYGTGMRLMELARTTIIYTHVVRNVSKALDQRTHRACEGIPQGEGGEEVHKILWPIFPGRHKGIDSFRSHVYQSA
jgi:hypothetical protein